MILLTQQERDKFAAWLEQEAKSDDEMATQINKFAVNDLMAKRMMQRAAMFSIVAIEIRKIESVTIEGG